MSAPLKGTDGKPVLAIGIEVGNHGLVEGWIRDGELPVLASLAGSGSLLPMSTVTEISSGSIWPSFSTGTSPLKNGQFFTHMQLQAGSYRIDKKYASDVRGEPFWSLLARRGYRVFSFDVAQTRPIEGFNGVNLCAWGSEYPAWPRSSWPKALMGELVARYGSHPLVNSYRLSISPRTEPEYRQFYGQLLTGLQRKGEIASDVLRRERWDLALIVFPEVHWAMHLLWQTWDRTHPEHDPGLVLPFDDIFLDLYKRLDAWIGRFQALMPGADVVVFSGSGLGPNYSGWHLLPEVLERIGLGPPPDGARRNRLADTLLPIRRWGSSKIRKIEDVLSIGTIEFLKRIVPAPAWDRLTRRLLHAGNRWAESKAFALPNDYSGAIRINLEGREPRGIVPPGEYESICARIEEELGKLVNPETGKRVVREVVRLKALYPHEDLGDFPDLIVTWANDAPVNAVTSPAVGRLARPFPERRSGAHRNDCFVLSSRGLEAAAGNGASLLDLAPTMFELLGEAPPRHFDGRSLLVG